MKHGKLGIMVLALLGLALSSVRAEESFIGSGTTFGMVGLSGRMSSGALFDDRHYHREESLFGIIDPVFRTGYGIMPGLAVGAELRLAHTFPRRENTYRNIPSFSFGPAVVLSRPLVSPFHWYLTATVGISHGMELAWSDYLHHYNGWDIGLSAGVLVLPLTSAGVSAEASWYLDAVRGLDLHEYWRKRKWRTGNTVSLGLRFCGVKP